MTRISLSTPSILLALLAMLAGPAAAQTITKCQDADGNWHYGDFAAESCAEKSTITEMDERGVEVRKSEAPPTQEELDARQAAEKAQQEEAARQARRQARDERLLQTYDSSEAIVRARDERLEALDRELDSHRIFRQDLLDEKQQIGDDGDAERLTEVNHQIEQYDDAIRGLEQQRQAVKQEYDTDLERYRALAGE